MVNHQLLFHYPFIPMRALPILKLLSSIPTLFWRKRSFEDISKIITGVWASTLSKIEECVSYFPLEESQPEKMLLFCFVHLFSGRSHQNHCSYFPFSSKSLLTFLFCYFLPYISQQHILKSCQPQCSHCYYLLRVHRLK